MHSFKLGSQTSKVRNSGVELLKIIAIFLIVISHFTNTIGKDIFLENSTTNIQVLVLMLMKQAGNLGNNVFFVCSAWFLVGKKATARKKAFSLLCTVWSISVLMLCLYLIIHPSYLTIKDIIRQIFPTCFENNWYMTCYIIFLFIYPWLNELMEITNQKQLLRITLFTSSLWIIANYLINSWFFPSILILWVTIYFLISYLKLYCCKIMSNIKFGIILLTVGIIGSVAQIVVTNYVGLYLINAFSNKVLHWSSNCCPFFIMIAIGSVIIVQKSNYKVKFINCISGLSMYVYLFHENYLFRTYTRPAIWKHLYENYGCSHVVLLDFICAIILFVVSVIVSFVYKETLQRFVMFVSNKLYSGLVRAYNRIEHFMLKIS